MNGTRTLMTSVATACLLGMLPAAATAAPCEAEPTDMSVAYGQLIECNIDPSTDTDVYRFTGVAGDRVLAELQAISGTASFNMRIQLIAPDGALLVDSAGVPIADQVLPLNGVYTIVASEGSTNATGDYTAMVSCVAGSCIPDPPGPPLPAPGSSIACEPEPTDMFPHYGTRVACDMTPHTDTDIYRFTATAGDRVLAEALTLGGTASFNLRLQLFAPDGTELVDTASVPRTDQVLPQTGSYTVVVSEGSTNATGQYAFTVSCLAGTCNPPGTGPGVTVTLTGCTVCQGGDQFKVNTHFFNTRQASVLTEVKIGFRTPSGETVTIANPPHAEFNFPGGFAFSGEFLSIPWPANQPPGVWSIEITVIGRDLGEVYAREVKSFTVAP